MAGRAVTVVFDGLWGRVECCLMGCLGSWVSLLEVYRYRVVFNIGNWIVQ